MRPEQIAAAALDKLGQDRYKLALIVAKRAKQLEAGAKPTLEHLDTQFDKLSDIALEEIARGKIDLESFTEAA